MNKNIFLTALLLAGALIHVQAQLSPNVKKQPANVPAIKKNTLPVVDAFASKTVTIRPTSLVNLCPTERRSGDHEFNDNELHVEVSASYSGTGSDILKAAIFISGTERGGDGSAVRQRFSIPIYTAPPGYLIKQVLSKDRSLAFSFDTKDKSKGKPQLLNACSTYSYNLEKSSLGFDLVQHILTEMHISTRNVNGDDFGEPGSDCSCGFRILSMSFAPVNILLVKKP